MVVWATPQGVLLTVHDGRSGLVVLGLRAQQGILAPLTSPDIALLCSTHLCDPHLLEGRERRQDGTTCRGSQVPNGQDFFEQHSFIELCLPIQTLKGRKKRERMEVSYHPDRVLSSEAIKFVTPTYQSI